MPTDPKVPENWRYYHFKGPATIAKMGESYLVYSPNEAVNPKKEFLRFGNKLISSPKINWTSDKMDNFTEIELTVGFDLDWFNHTMRNGFQLINEEGTLVTKFDDLEKPENEAAMDQMNPIVPAAADQ